MKKIITISREFGAGGATIGQRVAEELGYYYCDKDMIMHAALQSGTLTKEEINHYDERVPKNFGFTQSLFEFYNRPEDQKLFNAQKEAIRKIASKGNCVIVGRNTNIVLQEFDSSFHVFISANKYFRLRNLREKMPDFTDRQIEDKMKEVDRARRKYCTYYTNTEFGNADYYDLCLRSSSMGIDECVKIICDACR